jgi:hypothetical protein
MKRTQKSHASQRDFSPFYLYYDLHNKQNEKLYYLIFLYEYLAKVPNSSSIRIN